MASQPVTTASLECREESQDSQLILEALRAELGVPSVSASAEPQRPAGLARPLQAARQAAKGARLQHHGAESECWSATIQPDNHSKLTASSSHPQQSANSPVQPFSLTCPDNDHDRSREQTSIRPKLSLPHDKQSQTPECLPLAQHGYVNHVRAKFDSPRLLPCSNSISRDHLLFPRHRRRRRRSRARQSTNRNRQNAAQTSA